VSDRAWVSPGAAGDRPQRVDADLSDDAFTVAGDGQPLRLSGGFMHAESASQFGIVLTSTLSFPS
jgi:hypothetical protein